MEPARPSLLRYYIFLAVVAVVGLAAVIASGIHQGALAHDRQTSADITLLSGAITDRANSTHALPKTLGELTTSTTKLSTGTLRYPVSNYEYAVKAAGAYRLCASFNTSTTTNRTRPSVDPDPGMSIQPDDPYMHGAGRQCFNFYWTDNATVGPATGLPAPATRSSTPAIASFDPTTKPTLLCKTTVPAGALFISDDQVQTVSVKDKKITASAPPQHDPQTHVYYYWHKENLDVPVYTSSCDPILVTDLKPGDHFSGYVDSDYNIIALFNQ
ncbi:MAG TPA: hypothetical protein VI322_00865 [Candidatus Saccharimonadia bacterium]